MKIACIGNMNNNFFALARYLRDSGIDAELLLFNEEQKHFKPDSDSFDTGYGSFIRQLSWGDAHSFCYTPSSTVRKDLEKYDFLIVCGLAPAFLHKAGISIDLFMPYGSDIYQSPHKFNVRSWKDRMKNIYYSGIRKHQKAGIKKAKCVSLETYVSYAVKWVNDLDIASTVFDLGFPMVYDKEYAPDVIPRYYSQSKHYPAFKKIRDEHELVIFHHSRHIWKEGKIGMGKDEFKNNNVPIEAFARFLKRYSSLKACLVLFEYGWEVQASKDLIAELGIGENVRWFPVMPRKEIMVGLSLSDISAGDFNHGFFGGGVIWESLLSGKPLFTYRNDSRLARPDNAYPIVNVRSIDEFCAKLEEYKSNKEKFVQIGAGGRRWTVEYFSRTIQAITLLANSKAEGTDISSIVKDWKKDQRSSILELEPLYA